MRSHKPNYHLCMRLLLYLSLALSGLSALAQPPTPAQQTELEKAQAEFKQLTDPANMARLFDEQLRELKKNGATPAQIRELEQAKAETIRQLKASQSTPSTEGRAPARVPQKSTGLPMNTAGATAKNSVGQPDSLPLVMNTLPGRYSAVPHQIQFYAEAKLTPARFITYLQQQYGVQLVETDRFEGLQNRQYIQYEQQTGRFMIEPAYYTLQLNTDGFATLATGVLFDKVPLPKTAIPTPAQSLAALTTVLKAQGIDGRDTTAVKLLAGPLLIKEKLRPDAVAFRLVYKYRVRPWKEYVYFDPVQQQIAHRIPYVRTCRLPGDAHRPVREDEPEISPKKVKTYHFGEQTINTKIGRYLIDMKSPNLYVSDGEKTIEDKSLTWTNPTFTQLGYFDMLLTIRTASTLYQNLFGRKGYDGKNGQLYINRYEKDNADWDEDDRRINFGKTTKNVPYAVQDIAMHEFTHAVIDFTPAKLEYQGESGALNEAIADIMGALADARTGRGNPWVHHDKLNDSYVRNLASPKKSAFPAPDTYEGTYWINGNPNQYTAANDYGGVHTNSTVVSHWFYLMCEGGEGANDNQDAYKVDKVGMDVAAQLVYGALFLLNPSSDFKAFEVATEQIAEQRYGRDSPVVCSVRQAWFAVGLRDLEPPRCAPGWAFEIHTPDDNTGQLRRVASYYLKGDSVVVVTYDPDVKLKAFTRFSSPNITSVQLDADGLQVNTGPKNAGQFLAQKTGDIMAQYEAETARVLAEGKAELAQTTDPDQRKAIQQRMAQQQAMRPMVEQALKQATQTMNTGDIVSDLTTGEQFWGSRKAQKKFIRENSKPAPDYEGYHNRQFSPQKMGVQWRSTFEIPLRLTDLLLILPGAGGKGGIRPGIDFFLCGFPLTIGNNMQIRNIRESIPANFDTLFSSAAVFN